jgi:phenylalanyl-tRNA synthetase beta chain
MGGDATVREEADHPPTIVGRRDRSIERRVRQRLLDAGLYEVVNPSFISAEALDELRLPDDDVRRQLAEVANPLRASDRYMRTTLMAGLLENLKANRAQKRQNVAIFEKGRCYFPERERETVGILLAGRAREHWTERRDWDFYDLKGLVELTGMAFDEEGAEWSAPDEPRPWLHPGIQAEWRVDGEVIAEAGRLHPEIVQELELEGPILLAEIDYEALAGRPERDRRFEPYSDYPPVDRDVALVVDSEVGFSEIEGAIEAYRREDEAFDELAESVELFDVYEGEQVEAGRRSLAFSVRYRADDRTLTEQEVAPLDEGLVEWLGERIGADRR